MLLSFLDLFFASIFFNQTTFRGRNTLDIYQVENDVLNEAFSGSNQRLSSGSEDVFYSNSSPFIHQADDSGVGFGPFDVMLQIICAKSFVVNGSVFTEYNQQDSTFHNFFLSVRRSTCLRRFFRPSSEAQNCTYSVRYLSDRYCYLLLA